MALLSLSPCDLLAHHSRATAPSSCHMTTPSQHVTTTPPHMTPHSMYDPSRHTSLHCCFDPHLSHPNMLSFPTSPFSPHIHLPHLNTKFTSCSPSPPQHGAHLMLTFPTSPFTPQHVHFTPQRVHFTPQCALHLHINTSAPTVNIKSTRPLM